MTLDRGDDPPAISVVMAVHNGDQYLREAIDSVLGQTFAGFEFIIVDDASSDRTPDILKSYEDSRLRIITLSINIGLADALNIALGYARGEFVARMDADDVAYLQRFEIQLSTLRLHPDVVLLGSYYELISKNGVKFGGVQVLESSDYDIRRGLPDANQFCHPSVMMRRDVVRALGGYRSLAGRYAQDYDLWLRMAEMGALMNLPQPLLKYRVHEGQASVNKALAQRSAAEFYKSLATQRQFSGHEDIGIARTTVKRKQREIRAWVASDFLCRARSFEQQGLIAEAKSMKWRAFSVAPLSLPVRVLIIQSLRKYLACSIPRRS